MNLATFSPRPEQGQHFCIDQTIISLIIKTAHLTKKDTVLEIGAGTGILTRELAQKAGMVIAVENDSRLKEIWKREEEKTMPNNLELIWGDALHFLKQRIGFTKIVANIPYQLAEPIVQYLCTAPHVKLSVLMVPLSFAQKVREHPFYASFLQIDILSEVPKTAFLPPPRTVSALIKITPRTNIDDCAFLGQQLFLQRDKKLGNALREALIVVSESQGKKLTKKEAIQKIKERTISQNILQERVQRVPLKMMKKIMT